MVAPDQAQVPSLIYAVLSHAYPTEPPNSRSLSSRRQIVTAPHGSDRSAVTLTPQGTIVAAPRCRHSIRLPSTGRFQKQSHHFACEGKPRTQATTRLSRRAQARSPHPPHVCGKLAGEPQVAELAPSRGYFSMAQVLSVQRRGTASDPVRASVRHAEPRALAARLGSVRPDNRRRAVPCSAR